MSFRPNNFFMSLKLLSYLFLLAFIPHSHANYLDNQDVLIVGKTLWLYFDEPECSNNLKIYTPSLSSELYQANKPVKVLIKELSKSWLSGDKYNLEIVDDKVNGYIYYVDLNNDRGYTRYLYYIENSPNLALLKSACLTNIDPETKAKLILAEIKKREESYKKEVEISKQDYAEKQKTIQKQKDLDYQKRQEIQKKELYAENEKNIKELPNTLKGYGQLEFCVVYGQHLRVENEFTGENNFDDNDSRVVKTFKRELALRKTSINKERIINEVINLGMSRCELYASWGFPNNVNRSVGNWGVHNQHIYNEANVYTENGAVSSWQD